MSRGLMTSWPHLTEPRVATPLIYLCYTAAACTVNVVQMPTMPGLPTRPCFYDIDLNLDTEQVEGLFWRRTWLPDMSPCNFLNVGFRHKGHMLMTIYSSNVTFLWFHRTYRFLSNWDVLCIVDDCIGAPASCVHVYIFNKTYSYKWSLCICIVAFLIIQQLTWILWHFCHKIAMPRPQVVRPML